jgi:hypothetical protein
MRKILSSRRPKSQFIQQSMVSDELCEQVRELRIELTEALARLGETVRRTETMLVFTPRILRTRD